MAPASKIVSAGAVALTGALCVLGLGTTPQAGAAVVTVGSSLQASYAPTTCGDSIPGCTVVPLALSNPASSISSPIDGTVVRWRVKSAGPGGSFLVRVVTRDGESPTTTPTATSATATTAGANLETFPTQLPIKAGQLIGLDLLTASTTIGYDGAADGHYLYYVPTAPASGPASGELIDKGEVAFNADVQPLPKITSLTPGSGSFKGGTAVTISGTDFEGTTAVAFGSSPATSFSVVSETQITAVAPPVTALSKTPVTVTTIAGAASSAAAYTGTACVVPGLAAKKLKAVRKKLKKAGCALGKVKKLGDATSKSGKVAKQNPKAGKKLVPGAKVNVEIKV